ncbi:hypothetical protein GJAV_G00065870 [Gymnothorax javanicus]|nr:hypothetical protein GJAV_G00065870 [Gymnothorax javanicus]
MAGAGAGGRPGSVRSKTKAVSLARLLNRDCIRLLELYRERESFSLEQSLDKDRIINLTLNASHLSANERVWLLHSALHQCLRLLERVIGWEDDQGFGGAGEYKRMRTTVKDRLGHLLQSTKSLLVETEGITPPPPEPDNPETDGLKDRRVRSTSTPCGYLVQIHLIAAQNLQQRAVRNGSCLKNLHEILQSKWSATVHGREAVIGTESMAETVRSLFEYREPPTLDSDGEGSKPPPPRGRGCGRKRKGTPVKVCDRVFITEDEEESLSEHSYCPGDAQYQETEDRLPPPDGPYYLADPTQLCVSELGEEGGNGARTAVLYPAPPNCRIREVHCGSQVRLVVIAIRDIVKGEEITVDYSLTEWGENPVGFHNSVSPGGFECSSDAENHVKKEEESGPVSLSLSVSDYLTPSWSFSPSSSPLSHSEPSDSDREDEEDEEAGEAQGPRGRVQRRRRRRKGVSGAKKKAAGRPPGRLPVFSRVPPPQSSTPSSATARPLFKSPPAAPPATNINNNININIGRDGGVVEGVVTGGGGQRQCCPYCGRQFRCLARHLEKHHGQQPEVRAAAERAQTAPPLQPRPLAHPHHALHLSPSSPAISAPPTLSFSRDRDAPGHGGPGGVSLSLSLSPASLRKSPALSSPPRKSPAPPISTPARKSPAPPVSSPPRRCVSTATTPRKGGRRVKREKEEEEEERPMTKEEEVSAPVSQEAAKEGAQEANRARDEDSGGEEKKEVMSSSRRPHMMPLLSSLSSLVMYLRRLQHSAYLSLSRAPQSAEAWRLLCHASLAILILYNRRRECEASKLTIQEYQNRVTPQCPIPVPPGAPPALTPLEASLSPFERQTRPGVGVDPQNPYVFARPYHSPATPLRGTDLLRSLARSSGTRNPRALTQTRLRRQVAILTQLLLLGEGDGRGAGGPSAAQRLENFLQKEYHVTQSCAGIGQDPGLMGRVGRVVLCGERDGVLFRGMSLHHICLELDVMSGNSADSFTEDSDGEQGKEKAGASAGGVAKRGMANGKAPRQRKGNTPLPNSASPLASPNGRRRGTGQPKPGKRGVLKRPWSEAERKAVESHLTRNIMELRVPAKADCERCLQLCPLLVTNRRDWRAIKFYCHNRIQLLKKRRDREGISAMEAPPIC